MQALPTTPTRHRWDVAPAEARRIQSELRTEVVTEDRLELVHRVAGIDVGLIDGDRVARAAVAVLSFPDLELLESSMAVQPVRFPYVPGLLSFREIPVVLEALNGLQQQPDLLCCDGQGIAHPRRFGIACHLGVLTGLPSIGVAKSRLIGTHAEVPDEKGAWVELVDRDECIGAVLRTRKGVRPLYVSPGHRISVTTAVDYVMRCVTRYRLPETTRWAHRLASCPGVG